MRQKAFYTLKVRFTSPWQVVSLLHLLFTAIDTLDHGTLLDCLTSWFGVLGTACKVVNL